MREPWSTCASSTTSRSPRRRSSTPTWRSTLASASSSGCSLVRSNLAAWPIALLLLAMPFALSSGCRRGKAPSEQFTQAHGLFTRLYAAKLDDAFDDPQMAQVEELLQQVPENSLDFTGARELLARIREGRAALKAAAQARHAAQAQALASGGYQRML